MDTKQQIARLADAWAKNPRWNGITRPYSTEEVVRLRGSIHVEHTLARLGAERLWHLINAEPFVRALGAVTGNQAVQMVHAGLQAIYLSGWQVAADANDAAQTYPDQGLYPADSAPNLVRRINNALLRADQIDCLEGRNGTYWLAPILADAEAGFGGVLNTYEVVKALIEAGAAGVHLEDQMASLKKCGHMGGKVLVPAQEFVTKLAAARLASDVLDIPTILVARTDGLHGDLLTSDVDPADQPFLTGERTVEGYFRVKAGIDFAVSRARAYAPYADMLWCETATPDMGEAREFAQGIHEQFPGKPLAYNCSPSFNWKRHLSDTEIAHFQDKLAEMGYKFQFITLAGFHVLNAAMFDLAKAYRDHGMSAYALVQENEFEMERDYGYRAVKHQAFVGAGYFDAIQLVATAGQASTTALKGSTEEAQFTKHTK